MLRPAVLGLLLAGVIRATTFHVICAGLGGEPDYDTRFKSLAQDLAKLSAGAEAQVEVLTGGDAAKANLRSAVEKAVRAASAEDTIVVTFIGHGTFDGTDYKFNVPGADVTGGELGLWLEGTKAKQVIVLGTSAGGGAIGALRAPNRVIISATRTGTEKNAVVFPRFWVEAMRDASADSDKNESVTALEAFLFADLKTARYYETLKRLATEHPVLEDTGKGEGVRAPSPENGQGLLAGRVTVTHFGTAQKALSDPTKVALLRKKEAIEQAIDKLKYEKAAMPLEEYRKQLSSLLVDLAKLQEEIEK